VALLAEKIPENRRKGFEPVIIEIDLLGALEQEILRFAFPRHAGEVALDVGSKHRHPCCRKPFGQNLQGYRLAGTRRTGYEAMAVGQLQVEFLALGALAQKDGSVAHV
jgi:hypothetical protein